MFQNEILWQEPYGLRSFVFVSFDPQKIIDGGRNTQNSRLITDPNIGIITFHFFENSIS